MQTSALLDQIAARAVAGHGPAGVVLSLDRIAALLAALGNPHEALGQVIHVAGTNGKGSVIAHLSAIAEAAGLSVNSYTSPSLAGLRDQIVLGAGIVDEQALGEQLERVLDVMADAPATRFEAETAAAFLAFAQCPADVTLLETGLGGRLDATNVVAEPAVTVITPISLDHREYLGETLREIALEKAGIMKRAVPVVIAAQDDEVRDVLAVEARKVGAPALISGQDWRAYEERGRLIFQSETALFDLPIPALVGRHQIENAGTAIAAALALKRDGIDQNALSSGLQAVQWPGRLQNLAGTPLARLFPDGSELWIDGGHNAAAGAALAETLAHLEERAPKPLHLIVGMLAGKDPEAFLAPFAGLAALVVATPIPPDGLTRATAPGAPAEHVTVAAQSVGITARTARDFGHALQLSVAEAEGPVRALICGSLHLAGAVLARNADDGIS